MKLIRVGSYQININDGDYIQATIKPVLIGSEYDRYIRPQPEDVWLDIGGHVGSFTLLQDRDWGNYFELLEHLDGAFKTITAKTVRDGSWTTIVHATNR